MALAFEKGNKKLKKRKKYCTLRLANIKNNSLFLPGKWAFSHTEHGNTNWYYFYVEQFDNMCQV